MYGCANFLNPPTITHEFDNFVVMETSRNLLENSNVGRKAISRTFYQYYEDEFDLIVIVYNVPSTVSSNIPRSGQMNVVRNSILGDGVKQKDIGNRFGSTRVLKGIISLFHKDYTLGGPLLHEIMHLWVIDIEVIPTSAKAHWGFSSVNGQLGGFDGESLVYLGDSLYSVSGNFDEYGTWGAAKRPYAPLELYLAGWVSAKEVPDILVAEDATLWLEQDDDRREYHKNALYPRFAASGMTTWSIDKVIERIGERIPSVGESQKSFRMATIVIENDEFPLTSDDVKFLDAQIDLFTRNESVKNLEESRGFYNFWDATRGLATMNAELKSARRTTKDTKSENTSN